MRWIRNASLKAVATKSIDSQLIAQALQAGYSVEVLASAQIA